MMNDKPLPLPELSVSYWAWAAPGLVVFGVGLCWAPFAVNLTPDQLEGWFILFSYGLAITGAMFLVWAQYWARERGHARSTQALGLTFRRRVTDRDLEPYASHLLLAATGRCRRWAGYLMEGEFAGTRLTLFVYRFAGKLPLPNGDKVPWVGWQSVLLIPDLSGLPDFLLYPEEGEYELADGVEGSLRLIERDEAVLEIKDGGRKSLLRGPDEARIRRLFDRRQREEMGPLDGWTIECRGGRLLLYREGEVVVGDALGHFLQHGTRIATALRSVVPPPRREHNVPT